MSWDIFPKSKIQYFLEKLKGKFVQKETGKGLSTNDYTTAEKNKVATIDNKADKVSSATNCNLAGLNGSGNLTDSGWNGAKDTTSISGNPISISGLKSNQLAVNPIITLEPIQAGSGTPSPSNVRAISGYDKIEVLSCGKNIWDGKYSLANSLIVADGSISSISNYYVSSWMRVKSSQTYAISYVGGDGLSGSYICWYDSSKNVIATENWGSSKSHAINMPANAYYLRVSYYSTTRGLQIEEGSTATTYEPYHKTTDLSESLGQTVYHAIDNVREGKLDIDSADYTFTGNETWGSAWSGQAYRSPCLTSKPAVSMDTRVEVFACEFAEPKHINGVYLGQSGIAVSGTSVYISADLYSSISSFTGKKIVYAVETPTEIQLTPNEISLLKDYAYVSTNGTSIALDYHNGELASLSDVSQLGETLNKGLIPFTLDISNQMTKLLSSATFKAYRNGNVVQIAGRTGALSNGVNNIVQIPNALRDTNQMPIPMYIYLSASDSGKVNGMYIDGSGIIAASANSATGNGIIFSVVYVLP